MQADTPRRQERRTSSTFLRIARKRVMSASRFLARSEWPVWALLSWTLVLVSAIRVGLVRDEQRNGQ